MKRLTEMDESENYDIKEAESTTLHYDFYYKISDLTEALNKLGKLEDLEEEVGMPLEELTKELQHKDKDLDKACKELAKRTGSCPYDSEPKKECEKRCQSKIESVCWKEWLISDE